MKRLQIGGSAVLALAATVAATATCAPNESVSSDVMTREAFIETYVALRAAGLQTESRVISPEDRERILAEHHVAQEELLHFAEVHGGDATFMREVWEEVESRLEDRQTDVEPAR